GPGDGELFQIASAVDGLVEHILCADAPFERLAGCRDVALTEHVDTLQLERLHFERRGNPLHLHLVSEGNLWRTEPAKSAIGRSIGGNGACGDSNVVAGVGPECVDGATRENDRRQGDVGAPIHHYIDFTCSEASLSGDAGAMPDDAG